MNSNKTCTVRAVWRCGCSVVAIVIPLFLVALEKNLSVDFGKFCVLFCAMGSDRHATIKKENYVLISILWCMPCLWLSSRSPRMYICFVFFSFTFFSACHFSVCMCFYSALFWRYSYLLLLLLLLSLLLLLLFSDHVLCFANKPATALFLTHTRCSF